MLLRVHNRPYSKIVVGLALLGAACSTPPPAPLPPGELRLPPGLEVSHQHQFGTLLGGARVLQDDASPDGETTAAYRLTLEFLSLEEFTAQGLDPLASHTRIVATPQGDEPIRGATRFAVGAGFAEGERASELWAGYREGSAGRSVSAGTFEGPLPRGLSCKFNLEAIETIEDPDNYLVEWPERGPVTKRLTVGVEWRENDELGMGLGFSDLGASSRTVEQGPPPEGGRPTGRNLQHEWLVPDMVPEPDAGPLIVVVPSPFETGQGEAYAIRIEVHHAPRENPAEFRAQVTEAMESARAAGELALEGQQPASPEELELRALERAYLALKQTDDAEQARGILLRVADKGGAPMSTDLGLVVDEQRLRVWIDSLPEFESGTAAAAVDIGWQLERSAWLSLVAESMGQGLPLWLDALLLRHAGEAGRYPSTLQDLARSSVSEATFRQRLVTENLLFLEDSNISARVRAFDWLERREAAPAGFDALGSRDERRAALAAAADATQEGGQ